MNFFDAVKVCFIKYTNFSDRASRSEFWLFTLFLTILGIVVALIEGAMGVPWDELWAPGSTILTVVTFVPALSVTARRLHDVNRSGWWMLLYFTVIGILFPLLYWFCRKGDEGENNFGHHSIG